MKKLLRMSSNWTNLKPLEEGEHNIMSYMATQVQHLSTCPILFFLYISFTSFILFVDFNLLLFLGTKLLSLFLPKKLDISNRVLK